MNGQQFNENLLAASVFACINNRFTQLSHQIAAFTRTRNSLEEWLNWEAYWACKWTFGFRVIPKPCYSKMGVSRSKLYGDLLLECSEEKLLIEIALIHDDTGAKWKKS